jgi:hypothetical protein
MDGAMARFDLATHDFPITFAKKSIAQQLSVWKFEGYLPV